MFYQSLLPKVFANWRDYEQLRQLAGPMSINGSKAASFLLDELDRSVPCGDSDLPDDAVAMGRRVVFRLDAASEDESGVLVYPDEYVPSSGHILVCSPLGAALFGLRAGSSMFYTSATNRVREVTVVRVEMQERSNVLTFPLRKHGRPPETSDIGGPDDAA